MNKPVIGFIGVGLMGQGMAANILRAGYELHIKANRNRAPVEALLALGAQEASSAADLAQRCDIIHLCLSNSNQVETVMRGQGGILEGARPGLIVMDCTTADPNSTLALAAELEAKGGQFADVPLGRTPKEAEEGTLDAMVGASPELFAQIRPVIDCWAGNITHVGAVGDGHKMKLLMNMISMSYGALYAEVTALGAKVGIAPAMVQQVIGGSRLSNGFFETFMRYAAGRDGNAHKFAITNALKDIRYVNDMAAQAGAVSVVSAATLQYLTQVVARGHGDDYLPLLADHVAAMNGVDLAEFAKEQEAKE